MLLHFLLSRAAYAIMEELRICNRDHVSHKLNVLTICASTEEVCCSLP